MLLLKLRDYKKWSGLMYSHILLCAILAFKINMTC